MKRAALFALAMFALPAQARAQAQNQAQAAPPKPLHLAIDEDEVVDGASMFPSWGDVSITRHGRMPSLLHPRPNFVPEMLRSVENL